MDRDAAGYYCIGGIQLACPAGTYQQGTKRSSALDCVTCDAGGYCGIASAVPTPCGGDSYYCPPGSFFPLVAAPGGYESIVKLRACTSSST